MADKTDDYLKQLEKEIKSVYSKAHQEIKGQLEKVQGMLSEAKADTPQQRYLMLKRDRLQAIEKQIVDIELNAERTALDMIEKKMVDVYGYNYNLNAEQMGFATVENSAIKKILTREENPFVKIKALTDRDEISAKMKNEFMSSLLQGESIPKMARRFKNVGEGRLKNTIRIARTETTRVQNSAKMDVGKHGEELGFVMMKRWVATTDHRVRDDHLAMNGVEVEQDEPFVLPDGSKMMFPGDISMGADAGQVINCRCTVVEFIKRDEEGNLVMKGDVDKYQEGGFKAIKNNN
jgi:uncharacterized protein with gpF-like domain